MEYALFTLYHSVLISLWRCTHMWWKKKDLSSHGFVLRTERSSHIVAIQNTEQ